jgi:uncharacterized protein (TIRG00374 family)
MGKVNPILGVAWVIPETPPSGSERVQAWWDVSPERGLVLRRARRAVMARDLRASPEPGPEQGAVGSAGEPAPAPAPAEDAGSEGGGQGLRSRVTRFVPKPLRHALVAFLCLLIIEVFVWPAITSAKKSLALLRHVNVVWMLAGVVVEAGALLAYALLTRTVLPSDGPDLWTIARVDMSTLAVSHVIPGGTASSTGLGYRLLTGLGVRGADAGFALGSQGIGSALVLNVLLWVALVVSIPIDGVHKGYVTVALVGVLLLILLAAIVYLLTIGEDVAARVIRAAAKPIPRLHPDRIEEVIKRIGQRLRDLGTDRLLLRRSLMWAALNWLLDAFCLWCFVAAFGSYISPIDLFVAYAVGNVLAAIPVTPGGLGIVEAAVSAALVGFGLTKGVATLAVIGWRLVNFWLPIPVGAGMYVSLRLDRGLRHRGREALAELRHLPDLATPVGSPAVPPEAS